MSELDLGRYYKLAHDEEKPMNEKVREFEELWNQEIKPNAPANLIPVVKIFAKKFFMLGIKMLESKLAEKEKDWDALNKIISEGSMEIKLLQARKHISTLEVKVKELEEELSKTNLMIEEGTFKLQDWVNRCRVAEVKVKELESKLSTLTYDCP